LSENNKLGNMVITKNNKKSPHAGKTQVFMQDKSEEI
jgi:hypothetical protein